MDEKKREEIHIDHIGWLMRRENLNCPVEKSDDNVIDLAEKAAAEEIFKEMDDIMDTAKTHWSTWNRYLELKKKFGVGVKK